MAYIPDEAIDESVEVSATAFRVYTYICRRRNHARQYAWLSVDNLMSALTLSKTTIYEAVRELEHKGWIARSENMWQPQKGSFWPVDRKHHARPE